MAEYWSHFAVSNLCVSTALALVAGAVHMRGGHPHLAHLLWLLVLVKLLTPHAFTVPLLPMGSQGIASSALSAEELAQGTAASELPLFIEGDSNGPQVLSILAGLWFAGSLLAAAWSLARVFRFRRLLARAARPVPPNLQRDARELAQRLGLRHTPAIQCTPALLAPFVWCITGRPQVFIPQRIIESFSGEELRMVLSHELAHVKRRDHWVRWVEWLACVTFWWNPITWLARRNLRVAEELACDAMVLETLRPDRRDYASSLLSVAELLSTEAIRPPAVASAMNSGGKLEERLTMIITEQLPKTPRWLRSAALALGAAVLPLSVAYAQDFDAVEHRLVSAVDAGELTLEQAALMMEALRRTEHKGAEAEEHALEAKKARYVELQRRLEAAVKGGKLTAEQAEEKLLQAREEMFRPSEEARELEAKKARYKELERRLEAAVKAGKISAEDAEKKLVLARKEMFQPREEAREMEARKARYNELARRLEKAVKDGKISAEDAKKKLAEARKDIFRPSEDARDLEARKARYNELARKLEKAVKDGSITAEDAKRKLAEVRTDLLPPASADHDMEARKARYQELARRLEQAIKAGEITAEDAEKKLAEVRKKMFGKPDKK